MLLLAADDSIGEGGGVGDPGMEGGIAVYSEAPTGGVKGKSLWEVVRKSVKSEELWTKDAIWREVRHRFDRACQGFLLLLRCTPCPPVPPMVRVHPSRWAVLMYITRALLTMLRASNTDSVCL